MDIYIDGSKKAGHCGWAVYWESGDCAQGLTSIPKCLKGTQTCARAEVEALLQALRLIYKSPNKHNPYIIHSDNIYTINGYNQWLHKWQSTGLLSKIHHETIAHSDLWSEIWKYKQLLPLVTVKYVPAHVGIVGNEIADKAAKGELDLSSCSIPSSQVNQVGENFIPSTNIFNEGYGPQTPLNKFKQKLESHGYQVLERNVQHGVQVKVAGVPGGVTFYNTGKILQQGEGWQQWLN